MKNWTVGVPDRKIVSSLVFGCQVSSLTAAALAAKGYTTPESVSDNLNISELSDPFLILDMDKAADSINAAIDNGEKICFSILVNNQTVSASSVRPKVAKLLLTILNGN